MLSSEFAQPMADHVADERGAAEGGCDRLAAARGIVVGCAISACFWAAVGLWLFG